MGVISLAYFLKSDTTAPMNGTTQPHTIIFKGIIPKIGGSEVFAKGQVDPETKAVVLGTVETKIKTNDNQWEDKKLTLGELFFVSGTLSHLYRYCQ